MTKRMRFAGIACAMLTAGVWTTTAAQAGSSEGRSCLTSSARSLLSRIEQKFGSVQIISTCRPGATIGGSGRPSRHASGNAIDFEAGGRKGSILQWLVANHHSGGTMTYSGMNHIHVDIGHHFVSLAEASEEVEIGSEKWRNKVAFFGPREAR